MVMTPEISFEIVVFGQTVKEYYTYIIIQYIIRKNISNIFFFLFTP